MSAIQVRLLEISDLCDCVRMYADAYATPPYGQGWDDGVAEGIIREVKRLFPDECFVAEQEGQLVGFILCSSLAGIRATIEEFVVAPEHQRQGIGRQLLSWVLDYYRDRNFDFIELVANKEAPAYRLYRQEGFAETREYRLMSRQL